MSSYPSPATTKNRTIERITLSGTACIKIVYAYVHWVLIQAVPFAFCISISVLFGNGLSCILQTALFGETLRQSPFVLPSCITYILGGFTKGFFLVFHLKSVGGKTQIKLPPSSCVLFFLYKSLSACTLKQMCPLFPDTPVFLPPLK